MNNAVMSYYIISTEIGHKLGLLTHGGQPMNVVPPLHQVKRNALAAFATEDEAIDYCHAIGGDVCLVSADSIEVVL